MVIFLSKKWWRRRKFQKEFATYIIELDEQLNVDPDVDDLLDDIRDWALDLARTIIDRKGDEEIRNRIQKEMEESK